MFAHASSLHWLINAWSLLVLHRYATPTRLLAAYLCAVAASFIPSFSLSSLLPPLRSPEYSLSSLLSPHSSLLEVRPLLGFSVIIFFLLGSLPRRSVRRYIIATAPFLLLSFLVPGMAALHHLLMFLAGIAFAQISSCVQRFIIS